MILAAILADRRRHRLPGVGGTTCAINDCGRGTRRGRRHPRAPRPPHDRSCTSTRSSGSSTRRRASRSTGRTSSPAGKSVFFLVTYVLLLGRGAVPRPLRPAEHPLRAEPGRRREEGGERACSLVAGLAPVRRSARWAAWAGFHAWLRGAVDRGERHGRHARFRPRSSSASAGSTRPPTPSRTGRTTGFPCTAGHDGARGPEGHQGERTPRRWRGGRRAAWASAGRAACSSTAARGSPATRRSPSSGRSLVTRGAAAQLQHRSATSCPTWSRCSRRTSARSRIIIRDDVAEHAAADGRVLAVARTSSSSTCSSPTASSAAAAWPPARPTRPTRTTPGRCRSAQAHRYNADSRDGGFAERKARAGRRARARGAATSRASARASARRASTRPGPSS